MQRPKDPKTGRFIKRHNVAGDRAKETNAAKASSSTERPSERPWGPTLDELRAQVDELRANRSAAAGAAESPRVDPDKERRAERERLSDMPIDKMVEQLQATAREEAFKSNCRTAAEKINAGGFMPTPVVSFQIGQATEEKPRAESYSFSWMVCALLAGVFITLAMISIFPPPALTGPRQFHSLDEGKIYERVGMTSNLSGDRLGWSTDFLIERSGGSFRRVWVDSVPHSAPQFFELRDGRIIAAPVVERCHPTPVRN